MIRVEVKQWNGQFDRPGMLDFIRRKITGSQCHGSVLVDFEDAILTAEQVAYIMVGFPAHKYKFCGSIASLPQSLPANALIPPTPRPREKRRNSRRDGRRSD